MWIIASYVRLAIFVSIASVSSLVPSVVSNGLLLSGSGPASNADLIADATGEVQADATAEAQAWQD
jgi:hypothetical protein